MENSFKPGIKTVVFLCSLSAAILLLTAFLWYSTQHRENAVPAASMEQKPSAANTPGTASPQASPSPVPSPVAAESRTGTLKITAVGDILLGRGVGMRLEAQKKGYIYPFEKVADLLKKGDVIFGNLEEPITDSTVCLDGDVNKGGKYVLKNSTKAFEGIRYCGFNIMNLANNHILDYYSKGLSDTIELLDKNGIAHAGAGKNIEEARKPAVITRKGLKIGMLSYTDMSEVVYKGNPPLSFVASQDKPGVAPRRYEYIREDVDKLRKDVDILVVSLHWGKEESFDVLQEQRELAHKLMDQGVDIILGHHPHQFQGIEIYKGKPVIYSMGNFIFDQNDPENQEAFILDMDYTGTRLTSLTAIPVRTIGKTQVVPVTGSEAQGMLNREKALCEALGTKCEIKEDKVIFYVK